MLPMSMQLFQTGLQYQYFSKATLVYSMQGLIIFSRKKNDAKLIKNHRRRLMLSSAISYTCLHRSGSRAKSTNENNSYALCGHSTAYGNTRLWDCGFSHTDTHTHCRPSCMYTTGVDELHGDIHVHVKLSHTCKVVTLPVYSEHGR